MTPRKVTHTASLLAGEIARFVGQDDPENAERYRQAVNASFFELPDFVTFKRASERLPKSVREMPVKGFKGYTLRIMRHSDGVMYLLSAHRPGLTDNMKDRLTRDGINEL